MERCKAIIDMLAIRPDGFWFMDPVSEADVQSCASEAGLDRQSTPSRMELGGGHCGAQTRLVCCSHTSQDS